MLFLQGYFFGTVEDGFERPWQGFHLSIRHQPVASPG